MSDDCGAKTRTGSPCKRRPMPNGRCKLHGGASTGAPKGNQNTATHGIYAKFYTPEELNDLDAMKLGEVDGELKLCRIRLKRAMLAEQNAADELELDERVERDGGSEYVAAAERKFKRRDYHSIIDRLTGRIESLEKTRISLTAAQEVGAQGDKAPEGFEVVGYDADT